MFFYSCAHSHVLCTQPWLAFPRGPQLSEAVIFAAVLGLCSSLVVFAHSIFLSQLTHAGLDPLLHFLSENRCMKLLYD